MGMIEDAMVVFRTILSDSVASYLGYARSQYADHQWLKAVKLRMPVTDLLIGIDHVSTNQRYMDWLLLEPLSEAVFGAGTAFPMRGDQLYWHVSPTEVHRYEVASVGDAPAWEFFDPTHGSIRVHSLYLGIDPNPPTWALARPSPSSSESSSASTSESTSPSTSPSSSESASASTSPSSSESSSPSPSPP